MDQCDGIIYTRPGSKRSEGYRVYDTYGFDSDSELMTEYNYLGWARNWIEALVIYHTRVKDTDGECCVIILQCVPTEHVQLWGIIERTR